VGGAADGYFPLSDLSFDSAGSLYGTTYWGGLPTCYGGCGTLFKLTPGSSGQWSEGIVHFFGSSVADGYAPLSGVLVGRSGQLLGVTSGGPGTQTGYEGTLYDITP
jgi:uncharacterized repeat protein (TIGR03803 family)